MSFLDRMKQILQPCSSEIEDPKERLAMAKAIVLLEVAEYDESFDPSEKRCIEKILMSEFKYTSKQVQDLLVAAREERLANADLFYSTRDLNDQLSVEEKMDFMVQVWRVVLADDKVDYSENVLTHKLIQLLRLDRKAWLETKERATKEGEKSNP